jgi:hypothetical protein
VTGRLARKGDAGVQSLSKDEPCCLT